jgi:nicotinamide-nucleotide amidase
MSETLDIFELAKSLGEALQRRGWHATAAESCTGGAVAAAITLVPGASAWFEGSMVTYANRIKRDWLQVDESDLEQFGAVSEPVARQMAAGVKAALGADIAVAVSGIAGPDGGTPDKPVGTVWIAWAGSDGSVDARCCHLDGDRAEIQRQTVITALDGMLALANAP